MQPHTLHSWLHITVLCLTVRRPAAGPLHNPTLCCQSGTEQRCDLMQHSETCKSPHNSGIWHSEAHNTVQSNGDLPKV